MRNQKDGVFSNVGMKLFTNFANVLLQFMQLIRGKVEEKEIVYKNMNMSNLYNRICKNFLIFSETEHEHHLQLPGASFVCD